MTTLKPPRGGLISSLSIVAILFGLLTIKEGGAVLLGNEAPTFIRVCKISR